MNSRMIPFIQTLSILVSIACLTPSLAAESTLVTTPLQEAAQSLNRDEQNVRSQLAREANGCSNLSQIQKKFPEFTQLYCRPMPSSQALPFYRKLESIVGIGPQTLPCMAALTQSCGFTIGSSYRSAFLLDWMYWNSKVDQLGREISEVLRTRDVFYEQKAIIEAREYIKLDQAIRSGKHPPEIESSFMNIGEFPMAKAIEYVAQKLDLKVIESVTEIIALQNHNTAMQPLIFKDDIWQVLHSPEDIQLIRAFYVFLKEHLRGDPKDPIFRRQMAKRNGGWQKLTELARGDHERIFRVIGTLATQRSWALQKFADALAREGKLTSEQLLALHEGHMSYYLINQLDERTSRLKPNGIDVEYHYFYPPQYSTDNWKHYHWFANAHLGCQLVLRAGLSPESARLGTELLAMTYEYVTLNLTGPSMKAMGVDPRISPVLEGTRDIHINTQGGDFGARTCAATLRKSSP